MLALQNYKSTSLKQRGLLMPKYKNYLTLKEMWIVFGLKQFYVDKRIFNKDPL